MFFMHVAREALFLFIFFLNGSGEQKLQKNVQKYFGNRYVFAFIKYLHVLFFIIIIIFLLFLKFV